jgi:hypothetical protein
MAKTNNKQYRPNIIVPRFVKHNPVLYAPNAQQPRGINQGVGTTFIPTELLPYVAIGYLPEDYVEKSL